MIVQFHIEPPRPQTLTKEDPVREWAFPDGTPWTAFYRTRGGFLLRFPGLADYLVSEDTLQVGCHPVPGVPDDTVQHLYFNQVLPLVLSHRGKLVLHAAAVEVDSYAVAFVGESGRGKSTLAAAFVTGGYRLLADDGLAIEEGDNIHYAQPSHPAIRLWRDSYRALVPEGVQEDSGSTATAKACFITGQEVSHCAEARQLRRIYLLGGDRAGTVSIEPITPVEAFVEIVRHSFILDIHATDALAAHFDRVSRLVCLPVLFRLEYARRFQDLTKVRNAVLEHSRL